MEQGTRREVRDSRFVVFFVRAELCCTVRKEECFLAEPDQNAERVPAEDNVGEGRDRTTNSIQQERGYLNCSVALVKASIAPVAFRYHTMTLADTS